MKVESHIFIYSEKYNLRGDQTLVFHQYTLFLKTGSRGIRAQSSYPKALFTLDFMALTTPISKESDLLV